MTVEQIEKTIDKINATMAMEGMPLTAEDKKAVKDILVGKKTAEESKREVIAKYAQTSDTKRHYGTI